MVDGGAVEPRESVGDRARPPIVTRAFVFLFGAHFLQALGFSSMLLLPLYLAHLGAGRAEIGAVMAAASIGGLAGRPLVGWGLDRFGRKPVLGLGTAVLVAGMVLVAGVDRIGPLAYLMRVLVGLGAGTLFTGYFTLAADIVPAARRTEGLALFGISGLVPLAVNPLVEGVGVDPAQLRWLFPGIGMLILLSLPLLAPVPEPAGVRSKEPVPAAWVFAALRRRALLPVWAATAVFAGLVAVFMSFATVAAQDRGLPHPTLVWAAYAIGAVVVRLFGAGVPERLGPVRVGLAALGSYALGLLLAAGADTDVAMALAGLFAGIGHGYCFPVLSGQVVSRSPDALRGAGMAMFTGLWELARLVGAPAFGALADARGDRLMLLAAASLGFGGVLAWAALERLFGGSGSPPRS